MWPEGQEILPITIPYDKARDIIQKALDDMRESGRFDQIEAPKLYCLNCGWTGYESELVSKNNDSDYCHCTDCGGDNLEENKEVKRRIELTRKQLFSRIWERAKG